MLVRTTVDYSLLLSTVVQIVSIVNACSIWWKTQAFREFSGDQFRVLYRGRYTFQREFEINFFFTFETISVDIILLSLYQILTVSNATENHNYSFIALYTYLYIINTNMISIIFRMKYV